MNDMNHENSLRPTVLRRGASFIELAENRLAAGNARFQRSWRVGADGLLTPETFTDKTTGTEWLDAAAKRRNSPLPDADLPDEPRTVALVGVPAPSIIEAPALTAELTATGVSATLTYRFQVFDDASGVRMQVRATGSGSNVALLSPKVAPTGLDATAEPTGVEQDPVLSLIATGGDSAQPGPRDILEDLTLAPLHLRLTQVLLSDQTDQRNELASEREWLLHPSEAALPLPGCLFYAEDVTTGAGLIFVKEAPLPYARPVPSPFDLYVHPARRQFSFTGHGADDTEGGGGYAWATLAYNGGTAGRIAEMQAYQRCLRPYKSERDGVLVSNTWGDRNRDARITGDFMAREIEAGARLGVDVIQIDDGWQIGTTSNSVRALAENGVWEGFYAARDNFWEVNPARFPSGLAPLIAHAREKGMRFGLWFGPDSDNDFAHWRRDADTVLRLHRELNVDYFKIDGVKVRSKTGERNLCAFFDAVLTETEGRVVFDLDVTAEVRPGYFLLARGGPLFVENRYTDWHKYWPHHTLRNLWSLAHYVDPVRLRMEWLNHARHQDQYESDPLAPSAYRADYLFATVMFASPLGWFEASNLPDTYFADAAPLIAAWKAHRTAIFGGVIIPIGASPDGVSWTGFASVAPDRKSAHVLVFREASGRSDWRAPALPLLVNPHSPRAFERLGGDGDAALDENGFRVTVANSHRFFWGRVTL